MKSVLIVGPNFHNFLNAVAIAWRKNGYKVFVEGYDTPVHPFSGKNKWCHKFAKDKKLYKERNRDEWQPYFKKRFDAISPDLVFLLNGEFLTSETLEYFRSKGAIVILWMFDALSRIPLMLGVSAHSDYVFCYERTDVDCLNAQGMCAHFLPQACNDEYFPIVSEKDIDILFVGDIYSSEKRKRYLSSVIDAFPDRRLLFVGTYKPWYKGLWKWLTREHRDIYTNRNISPNQVNGLYNRARVVLNIHHEQQKEGANPKVFEICSSGAYQICDANPYLESLFRFGEVGLYHDEKELSALIEDALTNDKSEQARIAYDIVVNNHTFVQRVKYVLETINAKS